MLRKRYYCHRCVTYTHTHTHRYKPQLNDDTHKMFKSVIPPAIERQKAPFLSLWVNDSHFRDRQAKPLTSMTLENYSGNKRVYLEVRLALALSGFLWQFFLKTIYAKPAGFFRDQHF